MLSLRLHHSLWLLMLSLAGFIAPAFAQKNVNPAPVINFGFVGPDQFEKATTDTTAEAVVLYDYGEVTFDNDDNGLWLNGRYHVRLQILKKSAYDRATIQLPTRRTNFSTPESVSDFEGVTYNLTNGNVSADPLTKSGHFTEKASDQFWIEKYTLPNVREGSIIEYRYTMHTPFKISYNPKTWRFQQKIPVKWSEFNITIPDYFYYKILQSGYLPLTVNERQSTHVRLLPGQGEVTASVYRFAMSNVPAFRNEAYITTDDDYMSKIEFELSRYQWPGPGGLVTTNISVGWDALDKTLLDGATFGGQFKRAGFLRETAKTLLSQHPDSLGRIRAAYDFIRQSIKWNEQAALWSESIKKAFDDKKGDAADINLMLIALLREMDIDANPVILSTRSHGRINESFALLKKFNYVVAQVLVGGKDMLLDATDPYLPMGMLPTRCLNGTGRLVHYRTPRFLSLLPTERDIEVHSGSFTISKEGEITGTLTYSHGGYSAWTNRKRFVVDGKAKYLERVQNNRMAWQIDKVDFTGTDVKSPVFTENYTLTIPEACGRAGDRLYLRPMLTEAHWYNPFQEAERLYPVDFGVLMDDTFTALYNLPEGYQVEEMPKAVVMALPENGGRFSYQVQLNDQNQLQVISRISLRRTLYFAGEYSALREFFSQIVAKHAETVILKRGVVAEKK